MMAIRRVEEVIGAAPAGRSPAGLNGAETLAKPMLFYSYTLPSAAARKSLAEAGAVIFTALAALARAARELTRPLGGPPPAHIAPPAVPDAVREQLVGAANTTLTEHESKAIL